MPLRVTQGIPVNPTFQADPLDLFEANALTDNPALRAFEALLPHRLPVPLFQQKQDRWCWAACAHMVLNFYDDHSVDQCDFANWLFGRSSCCSNPSTSLCNKSCESGDVRRVYWQFELKSDFREGYVLFSTIKSEIDAGRPVEVGIKWNGDNNGGHAVIIKGYDERFGQRVLVNDPLEDSDVDMHYDDVLDMYGQGTWKWTWTGIRR